MKEIIHNYDNLKDEEINKYVKRAKAIIENYNNEILVVNSDKNYFLIGGHLDNEESFDDCIIREIKEEAGIEIPYKKRKPFFSIKYLCRDYPNKGDNTKYITNYYAIKYDLIPNIDNLNLTKDEIKGNFKLEYINKEKIIDVLTESLKSCTKENVVKDTILVIKQYLNID